MFFVKIGESWGGEKRKKLSRVTVYTHELTETAPAK